MGSGSLLSAPPISILQDWSTKDANSLQITINAAIREGTTIFNTIRTQGTGISFALPAVDQ